MRNISYLFLHNKLFQNLAAKSNNKHLLPHTVSESEEFRSRLTG